MRIPPPIIILGTPRSGSSLTAGLLVQSGVWAGVCRRADSRNPKGYFENIRFKELRLAGQICRSTVIRTLKNEKWEGGPWLVKHGAGSFADWLPFFPKYVLCRRAGEKSVDSWLRHDRATPRKIQEAKVRRDNRTMDRVRDDYGGIDFCPGSLVNGWNEFKSLCERLEVKPDMKRCAAFFDKSLWSGG